MIGWIVDIVQVIFIGLTIHSFASLKGRVMDLEREREGIQKWGYEVEDVLKDHHSHITGAINRLSRLDTSQDNNQSEGAN
jgi:hypothetical protein